MTAWAGYANYNSVLIGDKAAGMGGSFVALSGDPAACSFYNPATVARMTDNTLSASVNLFNKFETRFGDQGQFGEAPLRVNQGSIVPIPSSSGSVYSLGHFAMGLSIILPDFDIFTGEVSSSDQHTSSINLRDESLWIGGTAAINLNARNSLGLTMYYTSRTFSRSVTDRYENSGETTLFSEEKIFSQNSVIYILGYYHQLNDNWSLGISARAPSLPVNGKGSYTRSEISTAGTSTNPVNQTGIAAATRVPAKLAFGVGYEQERDLTLSLDVSYYFPENYDDFDLAEASERIRHRPTWNYNIGAEYFISPHISWRFGVFSNFSSHPDIPDANRSERYGDHIDMWGFSTNFSVYTGDKSSVTLGGYYNGGKGNSTQVIASEIKKIEKSIQIFSFLVGTTFRF